MEVDGAVLSRSRLEIDFVAGPAVPRHGSRRQVHGMAMQAAGPSVRDLSTRRAEGEIPSRKQVLACVRWLGAIPEALDFTGLQRPAVKAGAVDFAVEVAGHLSPRSVGLGSSTLPSGVGRIGQQCPPSRRRRPLPLPTGPVAMESPVPARAGRPHPRRPRWPPRSTIATARAPSRSGTSPRNPLHRRSGGSDPGRPGTGRNPPAPIRTTESGSPCPSFSGVVGRTQA